MTQLDSLVGKRVIMHATGINCVQHFDNSSGIIKETTDSYIRVAIDSGSNYHINNMVSFHIAPTGFTFSIVPGEWDE